MLVSVEKVKEFIGLEVEDTDDVGILTTMIGAAEEYLLEATGKTFTSECNRAVLFVSVLVGYWYDNRSMIGKTGDKINDTIKSLTLQLKYGGVS